MKRFLLLAGWCIILYIKELYLENYRNYHKEGVVLCPGNYIVQGANGQGKSNLLEALHYLCSARSFRPARESDIVRWGAPYFYLRGKLILEGREYLVEAGFEQKRRRKVYKVNGRVEKTSSRSISCPVVFFVPEDLELVRRGPEERRRFMDQVLSQMDPLYEGYLRRYYRALFQKNRLFKQNLPSNREKELLAPWNEQLVHFGSLLVRERAKMVLHWNQKTKTNFDLLFDGKGGLEMKYASFLGQKLPLQLEEVKERFVFEMEKLSYQEKKRGYSLAGPHRDELVFLIDGREARRFASHGQQRSIVLSLKAAQINLHQEEGEKPLFLLDDIFSELDERRREQCFALLSGAAQTFITVTRKERYLLPFLERYPETSFLAVEGGHIQRMDNV